MHKPTLGIIRENKIPVDRRVPLIPDHLRQISDKFGITTKIQKSDIRCYTDDEYLKQGIPMQDQVNECDILMGVKEVPVSHLVPDKTYLFFSHTIKKQPYNRKLLQEIIQRNIRLIDYELLTDPHGQRVVAFGRYAGIVGAYNGLLAYGLRYNLYHLRRARDCFDLEDLRKEFSKVKLPPVKIALTGGGRVAKGAMEVLMGMGIKKISPVDFLGRDYDEAVFTQLNARDYNKHKAQAPFRQEEFFMDPQQYEGDFLKYADKADILIAGAYWDPAAPVLFTIDDMRDSAFNIRVIADITCDIEGSIPSTKKASTIDDPFYDYMPTENRLAEAFSDEGNITVMAIDNLPNELPRDASHDFSSDLMEYVMPPLLMGNQTDIIERATIAQKGALTPRFSYLSDYAAASSE